MPKDSFFGRSPGKHYGCIRCAVKFNEDEATTWEALAKQTNEASAIRQYAETNAPGSNLDLFMKTVEETRAKK
jgi:hypothetical protein